MRTRVRSLVHLLVVASILVPLAYAAAQPKAKAPAVVLSVAGADALLGDVVYLTETAGVGDVGRLAALMATPYTTCLDKDKPLGVCLSVEDGRPMGMAFVPVKDLKLLLAALKAQVGEPKELDNGVFEIAGDKPQPVFIRQRGIWAFVSNSRDSLANVPEDPVGLLGGLNKEYTIAARVNVQSIPEEIRKMAVEQVRRGFAEGMQKNLPDRQREVAKKIGESWVKTIVSLIQDVEFVTLGFKADAKTQKTFLDFSVTAVAGTELAKQMALTQSGPSAFAGFLTSNGAVNLHVNAKSSADDIEQAVALLALVREEAGKGIDRDGNLGDADRATARRIVGQLLDVAEESIKAELREEVAKFEKANRLVEAQRLYERTMYDLEMLRELGYCPGIENYSRHLSQRPPGSRPYTLIDYFPKDSITILDESHVTVPQLFGMHRADRNRKLVLVEHGFRLPSALDNRPLNFDEFAALVGQGLFVSATPGTYELERTTPVQQVVRPTGLPDPAVEVRPLAGQVDDLIEEVRQCAGRGERVLATTLTKRTAEDLADYLRTLGLRVRYLHSELDAIERVEVIRSLRAGDFDCLVGINLLREGLDLPEVSLVAILDADKEGFLRSETSLIQTAGRAARHVNGRVILYADELTDSMTRMIELTRERRVRQERYNQAHHITPRSVQRAIQASLRLYQDAEQTVAHVVEEAGGDYDAHETIRRLEAEMLEAAAALEFERAAMLRDQVRTLRGVTSDRTGPAAGSAATPSESQRPSARLDHEGPALYRKPVRRSRDAKRSAGP